MKITKSLIFTLFACVQTARIPTDYANKLTEAYHAQRSGQVLHKATEPNESKEIEYVENVWPPLVVKTRENAKIYNRKNRIKRIYSL